VSEYHREQVERLIELADKDKADALSDPLTLKFLKILASDWDPDLGRSLRESLLVKKLEKKKAGNPFRKPLQEEVEGDLAQIGLTEGGALFGLDNRRLSMHIGIFGESRTGKTTAALQVIHSLKEGVRILSLDAKLDYTSVLGLRDDAVIVPWSKLRLNLLEPPLTAPLLQHLAAFADDFSDAFGFYAGSSFFLSEQINRLYEIHGSFEKGEYPSLLDLDSLLDTVKSSGRVNKDYLDRVRNRVRENVLILGKVLGCSRGHPIEKIVEEHSLVILMNGLPRSLAKFLTISILKRIFNYRINSGKRLGPIDLVVICDEAKLIFPQSMERRSPEGISALTSLISQISEFQVGLIVAEQIPTLLSDGIKGNLGTIICFRLSNGKDIAEVAKTMNLTKEEREYIPRLGTGEAIVRTVGVKDPFLVQVFDITEKIKKNISQDELKKSSLVLDSYPVSPRIDPDDILGKKKEEKLLGELTAEELSFSMDVINHPYLNFSERRISLSLTSYKANQIKTSLLKKEILEELPIKLVRGRGRPELFFELTAKGCRVLRVKEAQKGKGGFFHRLAQRVVSEYYQRKGFKTEIESLVKGRLVDVLVEKKNGRILAVEIETGMSNYLENAKENAPLFEKVIIVTPVEEKLFQRIKKDILSGLPEAVRSKFKFFTLEHFRSLNSRQDTQ